MSCKGIIILVSVLASTQLLSGQTNPFRIDRARVQVSIDSLQLLVNSGQDDSIKLARLLLLTEKEIIFPDAAVSPANALRSRALAIRLRDKQAEILACRNLGMIAQNKGAFMEAIGYYQEAADLVEKYDMHLQTDDPYPAILNLYFYLGDYPSAMQVVLKQLAIAEQINSRKRIADCHNLLGYIHFKQEDLAESEKYYALYIEDAKELNDSTMIAHALGEVADLYTHEKKYGSALDALAQCTMICDRILKYPNPAEPWRSKAPQFKAKAMYRTSRIYALQGKLDDALIYGLGAVSFTKTHPSTRYDIASYYINAGDIYKQMGQAARSISFLSYGYQLSRQIIHRENTRDAARSLADAYAQTGRFDSAFIFYQLYTGLKDSIVNNETKMKIAGIQARYDVAKKDKQIARQKELGYILIGSLLVLLIILLLVYNSYRLKAKNRDQLAQHRQQNELFNAIVTTQDRERKRIAQDIHDSLGSILSAAKLKLSALDVGTSQFSSEQMEKYRTTLSLLNEASSELRNISHNIMPATLSKLGLVAALQSLIDKISAHSSLRINFTAHDFEERLDEISEMSIYRILLELINNVVKHSNANKLTIQMIRYPGYINLTVEDNGQGFDLNGIQEEKKGIGLGNIHSRVEYLKGTIEVDSAAGKGTTVIIEIPYAAA